jgi:hypothetical protein
MAEAIKTKAHHPVSQAFDSPVLSRKKGESHEKSGV